MSFAERLRDLRLQNEMTQEYVANRINLARSTIAGYETKNRQPSHENLTALAGLFHVSIDYLLDNDTELTVDTGCSNHRVLSEQKLLYKYRRLSLESKKDLAGYIHLLEVRDHTPSGSKNSDIT